MEKIKYRTLVDYILELLKEIRHQHTGKFLSLSSILDYFDYKMPYSDVIELGKYLETRGWAKVVYVLGDVMVQITTPGILYIEDKSKEFYQEYLDFAVELKKLGKSSVTAFEDDLINPKQKVITLIERISKKIKEKQGLETDLDKDLEIIKIEVQKTVPDIKLIEEKLNQFNNLPYLLDDIQELKDYISFAGSLPFSTGYIGR